MFVYEFLWRGQPPGSDQLPAYHVILADVVKSGLGMDVITPSTALTPQQAESLGFPLKQIVKDINGKALADLSEVMSANAALQEENAALAAQLAELRASGDEVAADAAALQSDIDTARRERDAAVAKLVAAEARLASAAEPT